MIAAAALLAATCSIVAFCSAAYVWGGVLVLVTAVLLGIAIKGDSKTVSSTADVVGNLAFTLNPPSSGLKPVEADSTSGRQSKESGEGQGPEMEGKAKNRTS